MKFNWLVTMVVLPLSISAWASSNGASQSAAPHASFIGSKEIMSAVRQNDAGALSDTALDVVPVESKYNVGVAVVRRSKVDGRMLPDALVHNEVTEVYQIIKGEGVLVTGGALTSAKPVTSDAIVDEIGPSSLGQSIVGGTRHQVGPGDIIIIPPHTPHGFVDITTPRIVYTIIRIDPNKVLKLPNKSQ